MTHSQPYGLKAYTGCLLGLAVGDALGTSVEFQAPHSFSPLTDMIGGGFFELTAGQWTDDTSMALCLAESLITKQAFDPVDQMERYLLWYQQGHLSSTDKCFDIGNTVLNALKTFEKTREPYCGLTDIQAAGNGSLMRLAPVPLFYAYNPLNAIQYAANSSQTTHATRTAVDACRFFAGLLIGALQGESKTTLLSTRYCPLADYWHTYPLAPEIDAIACGSYKQKIPPPPSVVKHWSEIENNRYIRGTGYVVNSLEAALWAFYHTETYTDGVLKAVNLGDDADTTGAIYGQLAGAFYGETAIRPDWLAKLAHRKRITDYATQLATLAWQRQYPS
ncbi:ADP-ribosylglycohydrolase family protein [Beggiatoa leptomitoformis]|uniref:ADP-ribosylglycohydrolase family protein n=1 Tax=Beggiatoa leptomitoformis TaxID=288004 RepID=A0A2N9YDE1_9GAMM|nr:ADP-ribosylglycohydrolase family protein [Beggiatoa leptomitoformis]ALG69196.1 ADP-ribosylglycohydrolase family protein [Beggiatoa leptomitoformis]AUI68375.1 ADP-ribosylglycohydrolase family protein [Beggiatoa leptomitoformis]